MLDKCLDFLGLSNSQVWRHITSSTPPPRPTKIEDTLLVLNYSWWKRNCQTVLHPLQSKFQNCICIWETWTLWFWKYSLSTSCRIFKHKPAWWSQPIDQQNFPQFLTHFLWYHIIFFYPLFHCFNIKSFLDSLEKELKRVPLASNI